MGKILLSIILSLSISLVYSQNVLFDSLKSQLHKKFPSSYDTSKMYFQIFTDGGLNYLTPIYQYILNGERMKEAMGKKNFYDNATQWISFIDYQASNNLAKIEDDTLTSKTEKDITQLISSYENAKHVAAKKYIAKKSEAYQIIMINEAHDDPSHRAFTFSLLDNLYRKGFRYFAMETFNNHDPSALDKVTSLMGTYTLEPVGAELVRHAIKLGYRLVAYEDTAFSANHTSTERDSIQANNLYQVFRKDNMAKIIVHAGYGHIMKQAMGDYIPLGKALYNLSRKSYLSINQTSYSEGTTGRFSKKLHESYLHKYLIKKPVISLTKNEALFNTGMYDLYVIHPKTNFTDQRPSWISLNGYRKKYDISHKIITAGTFLVQAYYRKELLNNKIKNLIPADQTYYKTGEGNYVLYLQKGEYVIVLRDAYYNVLREINIKIS